MAGPYAFVTLVSSDAYLPGALAQAAALRDIHPSPPVFPEVSFQTVCLVTPETVDVATIKLLRRAFDLVIGVEVLEHENKQNLQLLGRPDLTTVLTKLHVFRLIQYSKLIFLDADVLPIRPLSHLFHIPHEFAAAPDVGWPDIFNSGVLVLSPGIDSFNQLMELLNSKGSWDGGDQGLLNEWRAGDWHRLSFTYNTTPTAAYTYAPAYERYGSQINAIHFIGPNKPWNAIPFRSPFLADKRPSTAEPQASQQAYSYESLVDRWFSVYDKHYRSQPIPKPSFEVQRYPSAWHSSSPATPSKTTTDRLFTLEDLRKIAIEGMTNAGFGSSSLSGKSGEGAYQTMPLEGRLDLMRPRKSSVKNEGGMSSTPEATPSAEPELESDYFGSTGDLPLTPMVRHLDIAEDPVRWHTLPTPGPHELPPSPKFRLKSLPSAPATPTPDYYASSAGPTSDSEGWGSAHESSGHISPFPSHLFTQTPPPRGPPSKGASLGESFNSQQYLPGHDQPQNQQQNQHIPQNSEGEDLAHPFPHLGSSTSQPPRNRSSHLLSPPLISWNPAIEPPPNDPPPHSNFPSDTYFTNVWDVNYQRERSSSPKSTPGHSSGFFQAPPLPQIPETLLEQGHYRNVTGEGSLASSTSPDPSKVKPIFPWEDRPRKMPGRVFPESDAPPPGRFANAKKPTTPPTPTLKSSDRAAPAKVKTPSPIPGLPTSLNFSNAWDHVPSIQNYASRLVRPPSGPSPIPTSAGDRWHHNGHGHNWDEKIEANSQDGDDEDEEDDEDTLDLDSDDDKRSRTRVRSPSAAEDTRQVQKSAQKTYRSLGVQTIPREKRSQSVQVSILVETPNQVTSRRSSFSSKRSSTGAGNTSGALQGRDANSKFLVKPGSFPAPGSDRPSFISNGSHTHSSPPLEHAPYSQRNFITSPPHQPQRLPSKSFPPLASEPPRIVIPSLVPAPSPVVPKVMPTPKVSTPPARPSIQTNQHVLNPAKIPSLSRRQISNDSSIGSPPSSIGPASPPDGQPLKGKRVWDPARGVELFKRGSEEVLARFLKMGSWDENTR